MKRIGLLRKHGFARASAAISFFVVLLAASAAILLPRAASREEPVPEYAASYAAAPIACSFDAGTGAKISFSFHPAKPAVNRVPIYKIQEIPQLAKTMVTFYGADSLQGQFDFNEVVSNPLIHSLDYSVREGNLVVEINRKGNYVPALINGGGDSVVITLPPGDAHFPKVFDQRPGDNSAAVPIFRKILFKAGMEAPLKTSVIIFENATVASTTADIVDSTTYLFSFSENIEKDKEYNVRAIITDAQNRTVAAGWTFEGQIPVEAALGKDRFKYLGWWGEINTDSISVRKSPDSSSERVGTLSSANRVKILQEVAGETIDDNNLWYKIDGGMYPGAYVFSGYIMPMVQPVPATSPIPDTVEKGGKWIDVDLTKKILTLFDYDKPVFATYISPGRLENPTAAGTYAVWYKLRKAEMRGGPPLHRYRYDLKNIPWVMFYNYDYAIHGTYWHDRFGSPQSAGCTNMTRGDAKFIFDNTLPTIPEGKDWLLTSKDSPGTVVYNHY